MSAAMSLLSEDDFLCSICLDLFTDPVSTPCGHNFCKKCISELKKKECRCPVCRQAFNQKGKFKVNSFIAQMVALLRLSSKQEARGSRSELRVANPGDVQCDICTGTKLKAQKSCLVCLVSYCETHLKPHLRVPGLIKHQLIDPVGNLEDKMCKKHEKPLELFCVTDETCVCVDCPLLDHKTHEIALLTAHEEKKLELKKMEAEIQRRQLKIQELKHSMEFSKGDVDREIVKGVQVFTSVKESVEKEEAEYVRTIEGKQRSIERRAQTYIDELEQEISELMERKYKLEKHSLSGDHISLQETVQALNIDHPIPTKDWTEVSIHPFLWERIAVKALLHLEETVSKKKVTLAEAELMVVQRYAVDVTLNPRTAHRKLILSEDGKQVHHGNVWQKIPDYPERFSKSVSVLGKQSLSSGRFYFDIQVKGKTEWVLGVVRESIKRKGSITLCPKNGSWTILLRNGNLYKAHTGPAACLPVKVLPEKVGVFVDYEEGLVSFFDVFTEALVCSFTGCSFTEKLFPFFSPCLNMDGKNATPMIICAVAQTE